MQVASLLCPLPLPLLAKQEPQHRQWRQMALVPGAGEAASQTPPSPVREQATGGCSSSRTEVKPLLRPGAAQTTT